MEEVTMDDYIQHVGILGMRWGRRKSKSSPSADHIKAHSLKTKKLSEMSNEEIRTLTNRMQLESQFKNLQPKKVNYGKKIASATLGSFGKQVVSGLVVAGSVATVKVIVDNVTKYGPLLKMVGKKY
jgi:hypothetical protein